MSGKPDWYSIEIGDLTSVATQTDMVSKANDCWIINNDMKTYIRRD